MFPRRGSERYKAACRTASTVLAAASALGMVLYAFAGHALIQAMHAQRAWPALNALIHDRHYSVRYFHGRLDTVVSVLLTIAAAVVVALAVEAGEAWVERRRAAVERLIEAMGLFTGYLALVNVGGGWPWIPVDEAMAFIADAPYNHRVVFATVANGIHAVFRSWSPMECFYASQVAALALAFWGVRLYASHFVERRYLFLAPVITLFMWMPTLSYYTFYDIGIIFFYAVCLTCIRRGRYGLFLVFFAIGTLNHESTLFLVPLAAYHDHDKVPARAWMSRAALALVCYAGVRLVMFYALPADHLANERIGYNLDLIFHKPQIVVKSFFWPAWGYLLAAWGYRKAPEDLRRMTWLAAFLWVMTFLVGQFNEARQFDAFIPVLAALILHRLFPKERAAETA